MGQLEASKASIVVLKLAREDQGQAAVVHKTCLSSTWANISRLQTRPVVVNALVAARDLKLLLVRVWGSKAVSLGTTAVERAWFPDHLRNMNKSARWASRAWQQYRAVVSWKRDVVTALRKAETPFYMGRKNSKSEDSLEKTLLMLQDNQRASIRLGTLAGKPAGSESPRVPELGEIYMGRSVVIV